MWKFFITVAAITALAPEWPESTTVGQVAAQESGSVPEPNLDHRPRWGAR